jgi:ParB family transcriptional regulator, chromosome partitioning protein
VSKNSIESYGAKGKTNLLMFEPEKLVLVDDEKATLFDRRVLEALSEEFVLDVMLQGVHTPVKVRKNPETGKTEVVFGRKRTLAARECNKRWKEKDALARKVMAGPMVVPATVARESEVRLGLLMISENEARTADSPMNRAEKAQRLLSRGATEEDVAVAMQCKVGTVKNLLKLLEATAAVRNAVNAGKVAVSEAYKLAELDPDVQRTRVAELVAQAPAAGGGRGGRRPAAAAKKAREIVSGGKGGGLKGKREVQAKLDEVMGKESMKEPIRMGIEAAFLWVMGAEGVLDSLLT